MVTTSRRAAGFYRQAQRAVDARRATAALRLAVNADPAFGLAIADLDAITGTVCATAPGQLCELCGSVITAGQEARLRFDGWWIHEACPVEW